MPAHHCSTLISRRIHGSTHLATGTNHTAGWLVMPLSRSEQRALRRLGRAAAAADPTLARTLTGAPDMVRPTNPVIRRMIWAFMAVAAALLAAGAIIGDIGLLTGGGLVLLSCPPTMLITNLALAHGQ